MEKNVFKIAKIIIASLLMLSLGLLLGTKGYLFAKKFAGNPKRPAPRINMIEISTDAKSILNAETKEIIFTIEDTQKYLRDSGYFYQPKADPPRADNPDTFQAANAKYNGECFLDASLSNSKDRIVFSTGCLPGDLPQAWVGVYNSRITKQTLCSGFNNLAPSAYACVGEENLQNLQKIYFLTSGSGRNFVWSKNDGTITYEADLGLSGMTETRTIDSQKGQI